MPWARDTGPAGNIFGTRYQRMLAELGRFLTVGGVATIVAFILFNVLVHGFSTGNHALLSDRPIRAYVLANRVGMVISYRGPRNWAFPTPPAGQAAGRRSGSLLGLPTPSTGRP